MVIQVNDSLFHVDDEACTYLYDVVQGNGQLYVVISTRKRNVIGIFPFTLAESNVSFMYKDPSLAGRRRLFICRVGEQFKSFYVNAERKIEAFGIVFLDSTRAVLMA